MALSKFKKFFDDSYQEILNKTLVAKEIANMRFEKTLKYGASIERSIIDLSAVRVRDAVRTNTASTIDTIADSSEFMTIDIEKEANFYIPDGDISQAGPLNAMQVAGKEIAIKMSLDFDARVLAEVANAANTFDTGDLTTLVSTGTPITMSGTTAPQMAARLGAKLRKNNVITTNLKFVIDSYDAAVMAEYLMGKEIDLAATMFSNGDLKGSVGGAKVYVSENLMGEAVLSMATQPTANDTVVINGLTFKFVASPSAEGDVDLGSDVDESRLHLSYAINQTGTAGTDYIAFTGDDLETLEDLRVTAVDSASADTLTIQCIGSGALTVSETFTDGTDAWGNNFTHSYFGKKGGIDAVMQEGVSSEIVRPGDRRGYNVLTSYLGAIKTFADGSRNFLDVKIAKA